jgi:hypothetical protein
MAKSDQPRRVSVRILECGHCGAPLEVDPGAPRAQCTYCGTRSVIETMRLVSEAPPPGWQPPAVWTPPENAPADSSVPLQYHAKLGTPQRRVVVAIIASSAVSLVIVVIAVVASLVSQGGRKRTTWTFGGTPSSHPSAPSAERVPLDRLRQVTLRESKPQLLQRLGVKTMAEISGVELASDVWSWVAFRWEAAEPGHVRDFRLTCRSPCRVSAQVRQRLRSLLPNLWQADTRRWDEIALSEHEGSININVSRDLSPHWQRQLELLWDVVRAAVLEPPVTVDRQALRDFLGTGHPLTALAQLPFGADVDGAPQAVAQRFRGLAPRKRSGLELTIALSHPFFREATLAWPNRKGAQLEQVELRPVGPKLSDQATILACVERGLGVKGRDMGGDYLARERDVIYRPRTGGEIRVYAFLVRITLRYDHWTRAMTEAGYQKLLEVLEACGR